LSEIDRLKAEREGYFMRNEQNAIEITCTEKFVAHWEKRGFIVTLKSL
jgi:hypothetical protein